VVMHMPQQHSLRMLAQARCWMTATSLDGYAAASRERPQWCVHLHGVPHVCQ
jgi:hypothetical protein